MKTSRLAIVALMVILSVAMLAGVAFSEEVKAKIKSIDAPKNTVVVSTDNAGDLTVVVEDKNAAEQLNSGKMKVGNKVKVKYENKGGKNVASSFKKLPGC